MITVGQIEAFLNGQFPPSRAMDWDRVGLNIGRRDAAVDTILVALDPLRESCLEAKSVGAQMLVTHHTLLWDPGFLTDGDAQGKNALFLIENGIAHYNAHTNLDLAPQGVNDALAKTLGLNDTRVLSPVSTDENGQVWGLLRGGFLPEQSLEEFMNTVKHTLGCPGLRYVSAGKPVHFVAVGGGACGEDMMDAITAGCDTFVTSDVKYNQFRDAYDRGLNLIDAGHFYTENPVCQHLAAVLREEFPELSVQISQNHQDYMKFC